MASRLFAILFISAGLVVSFAGFPFIPKKENPVYIDRVGVIEATEVYLSTKISERIAELPYDEGDLVPKGAVVVKLSTDELTAEAARAAADVGRGAAEIVTAKAILAKEKAARSETKRNLDRVSQLYRDGLISVAKRDEAATAHALAQAEVEVAKARIQSAEAQLTQYRAHLQLYQVRLKEGEIHAPISGLVTLKAYEVGEMTAPGATIVTLIDPASVWARIDLEEGAVGKIRIGGRADLFLESDRDTSFPGKIIEIGTAGAFATQRDVTRGRQDIKTFRVKIGVSSEEGLLKPGMTVRARIHFEKTKDTATNEGRAG
ncbi:MAG: HlyD family secretion protein [Nitrospiria bacterium]